MMFIIEVTEHQRGKLLGGTWCMLPQAQILKYGFDQQGWYGMFIACGIWYLVDVSSVSPSSEQTKG